MSVAGVWNRCSVDGTLPYLTLPPGWAGCYTCPALRPYQFGPMRYPDVTKGHSNRLWSRNIGCEAENSPAT